MPPKHGKKKINPRVDSREYTLTFPFHHTVLANVLRMSRCRPPEDVIPRESWVEFWTKFGFDQDGEGQLEVSLLPKSGGVVRMGFRWGCSHMGSYRYAFYPHTGMDMTFC
ncbi:hypothetical protein HNY73_009409 [Argiope bruennichi]|uniref:Uncharacterized protein n=1 Tax=Argiope bruennichi TaxID=94029 RepID=A0A8T0FF07_ARGBR|nr:hypothetical protein HNY73_009409 [Argiope bruennichi]